MRPGDMPDTGVVVEALGRDFDFAPASPVGEGIAGFLAPVSITVFNANGTLRHFFSTDKCNLHYHLFDVRYPIASRAYTNNGYMNFDAMEHRR